MFTLVGNIVFLETIKPFELNKRINQDLRLHKHQYLVMNLQKQLCKAADSEQTVEYKSLG